MVSRFLSSQVQSPAADNVEGVEKFGEEEITFDSDDDMKMLTKLMFVPSVHFSRPFCVVGKQNTKSDFPIQQWRHVQR